MYENFECLFIAHFHANITTKILKIFLARKKNHFLNFSCEICIYGNAQIPEGIV